MEREGIKELLKEVLGPNTELVDHSQWVGLRCPLAPWKHAKGTDSKPSAGVSVKDDDISIFHCWGCASKGPLPWLLKELEKYTGDSYIEIIRGLEHNEFLGGSLPEWGEKAVKRIQRIHYVEEEFLEYYEDAAKHPYLKERGITSKTARRIGLLLDPEDSEGDERILFPVRDPQGRLMGISGRATDDEARLRVRDYHGLQKSMALLGSHLLEGAEEVVVVEGLFDYAVGVETDQPFVAAMHAGLTDYQVSILKNLGLPVVLFFDNDKAGREATKTAVEQLRSWLPLREARYRWHKGADNKRWRYKDPGSMPDEEVIWSVKNARIL